MGEVAFKLRAATKDDHASIFSDWLRSGRKAQAYSGVPSQIYFFWVHLMIENLLAPMAKATWLVACAADDPTKIYGWLCGHRVDSLAGDQAILHYVYVKKLYRRLGIGSRLVEALRGPSEILVTTARTDAGRAFLHGQTHLYNPFLGFIWIPHPNGGPVVGPKHPHSVSRRALAGGGHVPEADCDA